MKRIYSSGIQLSAGLVALSLAACSGSGTNPDTPHQANLSATVLQFNVGTANLFGDTPAAALVGTNVVVTFRQAGGQLNPGASAALVSSPTLTIPGPALAGPAIASGGTLFTTVAKGPSTSEVGTNALTSTPQTGTNVTSFGISGGAFGLGLEPFNYGIRGVPDSSTPYSVPMFDNITGDPNKFIPMGGLPAFDPSGNAASTALLGVPLGLDVLALAPAVGTYSLGVTIPANTGAVTSTATAPITSLVTLPPTVPPVPTGVTATGGATFTYTLPAGVTDGYVQVENIGPSVADAASCLAATPTAPVFYTFHVTALAGTVTLPAGSFCTAADNNDAAGVTDADGDGFVVQTIGFDYPAFAISYPSSLGNPSPSVAGTSATHQADITVSSSAYYTNPGDGTAPLNVTARARVINATVHKTVTATKRG